jgi:hypothetical protein
MNRDPYDYGVDDIRPTYTKEYIHVYNLKQLKTLGSIWQDSERKLYMWCNVDITSINLPVGLTGITFGRLFNQVINGIRWPESITDIKFGHQFNKSIDSVEWPINLTMLGFGDMFNQVVTAWPKTLIVMSLAYDFQQDISSVEWPPNLYELQIGPNCMFFLGNTSICKLHLLGNHPNIVFPESIQYLCINPLDTPLYDISALKIPDKLITLDFAYTFNYVIDGIYFPETMHKLSFDGLFNQSLNNTKLPISLKELNLSFSFNQDITFMSRLHNLTILTLGSQFDQNIYNVKFHVIDTINDRSNKITMDSNNFPKSLRLIHRYKVDYYTPPKSYAYYLRPVGQFTKMAKNY